MTDEPDSSRARTPAQQTLLGLLGFQREHVLAPIEGLTEEQATTPMVASGWTVVTLLNHLAYDDETFWIGAVLAGDPVAIAAVRDGWREGPTTLAEAAAGYREAVARSERLLADADLDAPPAWTPPRSVFDAPVPPHGAALVGRVLMETATHAGHLDIVRELIDGRQFMVF